MHADVPFKTRLVGMVAWRLRPAWLASAFKNFCGVEPIEVEVDAGRMIVDPISNLGMRLIQDGFYEPELSDFFRSVLKPGDTFVDVGANEGYFSVLAASIVGSSGRLVAVEPQERLHQKLEANFGANQIDNFQLIAVAISDSAGNTIIHLTPDMNSGASGLSKVTKYNCETQEVELITLEELFKRSGVDIAHAVKMDIESFEYEAILGSKKIFESGRIRHLAVELHPEVMAARGKNVNDIISFLTSQNYKHSKVGPADVFTWNAT